MATTTDLSTLKINYLTQAQYDTALLNNQINADELYLTPSSSSLASHTDPGLMSPLDKTYLDSISGVLSNSSGTLKATGDIRVNNHVNAIGFTDGNSGEKSIATTSSPYTPVVLSGAITLYPGIFILTAEVNFAANGTGFRHIEWKTGSSTILNSRVTTPTVGTGAATRLQSTIIVEVPENVTNQDYYIYCYHTGGASLTVNYYWRFVRIA